MKYAIILNYPKREGYARKRLCDEIMLIDPSAEILMINRWEVSNSDFIFQVISFVPDVLVTYYSVTIDSNLINYYLKHFLKCHVVRIACEPISDVNDELRVLSYLGSDVYDDRVIDYEVFFGKAQADCITGYLLKSGKLKSSDQVFGFGHATFEKYLNSKLIDRDCVKSPRTILFATGFVYADYTLQLMKEVGDVLDVTKPDYEIKLEEAKAAIVIAKTIRDVWIEMISCLAEKYPDCSFILKTHPVENYWFEFNEFNPYKCLERFDNFKLVGDEVHVGDLLKKVDLFFHYGSITELEAYFAKVACYFVDVNSVIATLPKSRFYKGTKPYLPSGLIVDYRNISAVIDEYLNNNITFQRTKPIDQYMYDYFNIIPDENYEPAKKTAELLLSLKGKEPIPIETENHYFQKSLGLFGKLLYNEQILNLLEKADSLIENGNYEHALSILTYIMFFDKYNIGALKLLVVALSYLRKTDEAMKIVKLALVLAPDDADLKFNEKFLSDIIQRTVSVVIPTYNREKHIEKAVRSIQNQTMLVNEIMIVDDCSTDSTKLIVEQLQKQDLRIKYIVLSKNSGAQAARNAGIKNSSSNWIAFLDSDDEWLPNKVQRSFEVIQEDHVDVVYCNYIRREITGKEVAPYFTKHKGNVLSDLLHRSFVTFPGMMIKKDALADIGYLDESIQAWQEWDTAIRLARKFKFSYVPEPGFVWVHHAGDTISKNILKDGLGFFQILLKNVDDLIRYCSNEVIEQHINYVLQKLGQSKQGNTDDLIKQVKDLKSYILQRNNKHTDYKWLENIPEIESGKKVYIGAKETVLAARKKNLSVCDYVEELWENKGGTERVVSNILNDIVLDKADLVCEIGPGTGRYIEKVIEKLNPGSYHIYEIAKDWEFYLKKQYSPLVKACSADGKTLTDTKSSSCDLVMAHGVFVYISFLNSFEYFKEMIRVCKPGGYISFDFYSDKDFDIETINKWLETQERYPLVLPEQTVHRFFSSHGCDLIKSFKNKYGHSFSNYYLLRRG